MGCFEESLEWMELVPDERHGAKALERALWQAVIERSLIDATHTSLKGLEPDDFKAIKAEARNFFLWETCCATIKANFEAVCEYAGFTPERVRDTGLRFIQSGMPFYRRL